MSDDKCFVDVAGLVEDWLRTYVSTGDLRVGRSGPVCPFMPRALKHDFVGTHVRCDIDGVDEEGLVDALSAEIGTFGGPECLKNSSGVVLDSTIVVMPRMDTAGCARLDAVYEQVKRVAVTSGKMVGVFHPYCDDRAVRNPDFRVSIAPVALVAIRYMAPHDILFLNDSPRWFAEYDKRFNVYYQRGRVRDPLLLSLYRDARRRYGGEQA